MSQSTIYFCIITKTYQHAEVTRGSFWPRHLHQRGVVRVRVDDYTATQPAQ